jgi:hypothetical protein
MTGNKKGGSHALIFVSCLPAWTFLRAARASWELPVRRQSNHELGRKNRRT